MGNSLADVKSGRAVTNPVTAFSNFLAGYKSQIALALPKHLNADRMARLALTAFSQSEQLQRCDVKSIVSSIMVAGQMGLEIGVTGQGYLVPYKTTCTFVPGWQGIVDIVNRSGRATVWTGAVFDGDDFDYQLGDSPYCKHRPKGEDDPAKLLYVYAIGRVNGAEAPVIEVWPIAKVRRHFEKNNKVGDKHYAHRHWEMYARKIPLLQVCKYMPKSIELSRAMEADHASEEGRPMTLDGDFVTLTPDGVDTSTGEILSGAGAPPAGPSTTVDRPNSAAKLKQYLDRLERAAKSSDMEMVLDEARDELNAADADKLNAAYELKFGGEKS
jgi:recombination protein RecT